ncbi:MAG: hypothetical protein H6713_17595 [Myxococcales bacterium]|nr:hypothetical protein [Myxococcales bacterium]
MPAEEAVSRLRASVRGRAVENGRHDDHLRFEADENSFRLLLGPGDADDPAACVRGEFESRGDQTLMRVSTATIGVRTGGWLAVARELAPWTLGLALILGVPWLAGLLQGAQAAGKLVLWVLVYLVAVAYRFGRRALNRRRDAGELLSLVERAVNPVRALAEHAGPFRE